MLSEKKWAIIVYRQNQCLENTADIESTILNQFKFSSKKITEKAAEKELFPCIIIIIN